MKLIILALLCFLAFEVSSRHHRSHHTLTVVASADPKMSQVVFPQNDQGLIEFNTFLDNLRQFNMTQGELRMFFRLCDLNRDDRLSPDEWDTCTTIFIQPYEATCVKAKDYTLQAAEITACLKLPIFEVVPAKDASIDKPAADSIIDLLGRQDKKVNFADYVFMRRLAFAWKECSLDNMISKRRMECALSATTPQKRRFLPVSNQVFNVAIQLYKTLYKDNEAFLDFFSFARIAYIYYYFNEFELPFQEEYLTRKSLIKGIEEQTLPSSITVEMANQIFYAIDPDNDGNKGKLDFSGYASLVHLYKMFIKYSEVPKDAKFKVRVMNEAKFLEALKERQWDHLNAVLLDAVNLVEQKDYDAIVTEKDRPAGIDEREYYTRFAENNAADNSAKHKAIFKIFDTKLSSSWNFTTFSDFAKFTWAFQHIDLDGDGVVKNDDISIYLMGKVFMIPFNTFEMRRFETIAETIRSEQINVKEFYAFFNFKKIFKNFKILNTAHAVSLTNLKQGIENLGLKLSNATTKYSKEMLALSKLPSYNFEKAFRRAMKEEIMLNKVMKMKNDDKKVIKDEVELTKNTKNYKHYFESEMKGDVNWNNQP